MKKSIRGIRRRTTTRTRRKRRRRRRRILSQCTHVTLKIYVTASEIEIKVRTMHFAFNKSIQLSKATTSHYSLYCNEMLASVLLKGRVVFKVYLRSENYHCCIIRSCRGYLYAV